MPLLKVATLCQASDIKLAVVCCGRSTFMMLASLGRLSRRWAFRAFGVCVRFLVLQLHFLLYFIRPQRLGYPSP